MRGKIVNARNYDVKVDGDFERLDPISITVPDEAITVRQILQKHANGLTPDIAKEPVWNNYADHDDLDLEAVNRSGFDEKHDLNVALKKQIASDKAAVKAASDAHKASKAKAFDDKVKAGLNAAVREASEAANAKGKSEAKRSDGPEQ